ncbi:hypothetical protein [Spirosoma gilvum]
MEQGAWGMEQGWQGVGSGAGIAKSVNRALQSPLLATPAPCYPCSMLPAPRS